VLHHRLIGITGHRFHEALGLRDEAWRRGMKPVILIHETAHDAVRVALPDARAVLHDPVFRTDWSFNERTRDFVAMLHAQVDRELWRGDRVLMTVATQCEARALALWLRELPVERRPWILVLFPSDRWNRRGPEERERQVAEFRSLAADVAALAAADRRRLLFCSHTRGLSAEISSLLGQPLGVAPVPEIYKGMETLAAARPARLDRPPRVAVLGGARMEKGSLRVRPVVQACRRRRLALEFRVHLVNELLAPAEFEDLAAVAGEPGVTVVRGPLSRQEYLRLLAESDVLLLPYDRLPYRQRPSGTLAEAVGCGMPVVVPDGIWAAEQVEEGMAAGVVYEGDDAEAIAEALGRCAAAIEPLRAQARALAPSWMRTHSAQAFLDWMEGEIAARSLEPSR
jgi:hypothetical protein